MLSKLVEQSVNNLTTRQDLDWQQEGLESSIDKVVEEFSEVFQAYRSYKNAKLEELKKDLSMELVDLIRASMSCLYFLGIEVDQVWNENIKKNERRSKDEM